MEMESIQQTLEENNSKEFGHLVDRPTECVGSDECGKRKTMRRRPHKTWKGNMGKNINWEEARWTAKDRNKSKNPGHLKYYKYIYCKRHSCTIFTPYGQIKGQTILCTYITSSIVILDQLIGMFS